MPPPPVRRRLPLLGRAPTCSCPFRRTHMRRVLCCYVLRLLRRCRAGECLRRRGLRARPVCALCVRGWLAGCFLLLPSLPAPLCMLRALRGLPPPQMRSPLPREGRAGLLRSASSWKCSRRHCPQRESWRSNSPPRSWGWCMDHCMNRSGCPPLGVAAPASLQSTAPPSSPTSSQQRSRSGRKASVAYPKALCCSLLSSSSFLLSFLPLLF